VDRYLGRRGGSAGVRGWGRSWGEHVGSDQRDPVR
jgi:hypothetical protein